MTHRAELIMQAISTTLEAAVASATRYYGRDDPIDQSIPEGYDSGVILQMGSNDELETYFKHKDYELNFFVDLKTAVAAGTPVTTSLNALSALVVQTLDPSNNSDVAYGVAGAYDVQEGSTGEPERLEASDDVGVMRMYWTIKYRRDLNNPETYTP